MAKRSLPFVQWLLGEIEYTASKVRPEHHASLQHAALLSLAQQTETAARYLRELAEDVKPRPLERCPRGAHARLAPGQWCERCGSQRARV